MESVDTEDFLWPWDYYELIGFDSADEAHLDFNKTTKILETITIDFNNDKAIDDLLKSFIKDIEAKGGKPVTYKESDLQDYFWKDECISIDIFFRKNIGMSIIYSTDFRINNLTNVNPCAIILALWKTKYQQN